MSYIYEALKRAEDEHERGVVAARATGRRTFFGARSRSWAWILIGLLGANVVVLVTLVVVLGHRSPDTAGGAPDRSAVAKLAPTAAPAPAAPVGAARAEESVAPPAAPVAPATGVERPNVAPSSPSRDQRKPAAPSIERQPRASAPSRKSEARLDPEASARRPSATAEKVPVKPETAAMPAEPAQAVEPPNITLQVIVYSDVPSQRMVFIDGRRYVEGDALDSETVLDRIDPDGAVVKRRGVRFVIAARR